MLKAKSSDKKGVIRFKFLYAFSVTSVNTYY